MTDKGKGAPFKKTSSKAVNIASSSTAAKTEAITDCGCSEEQTQTSEPTQVAPRPAAGDSYTFFSKIVAMILLFQHQVCVAT